MYELLLKWGLDNLTGATKMKAGHGLSISLEAIKAKNQLIYKRYDHAFSAHQTLIDLTLEIEEKLDNFMNKNISTSNTVENANKIFSELQQEIHPIFYRKYKKIRSQFDCTNDLMSAYTTVFTDIVHMNTLRRLNKIKNNLSRGDISRTYRGLWVKLSELVGSLLRVSSSDLRFWVTDSPYVIHAEEWAKKDLIEVHKFFDADEWNGCQFRLSLETQEGLEDFWTTFKSPQKQLNI